NVLCDVPTGRAYWFDFETMHPLDRPRAWRQADDLRAFTFSVAARLPAEGLPDLARTLVDHYAGAAVLRELADMAEKLCGKPDPFHLGQTGISRRQSERWSAALQEQVGAGSPSH